MAKTAYVYVGRKSADNFAIGREKGIWGWEESVLDKADARAVAASLQVGDILALGHKGPSPRVESGGWAEAELEEVLFMRVARPLYESTVTVWPDKPYRYRIDLRFVDTMEKCGGSQLGQEAMELLRLSGCKQGAPVTEAGTEHVRKALLADSVVVTEPDQGANDELDVIVQAKARREQRKLRKDKFGEPAVITCDLCGRTLPSRLVRAAHIKRRSDCLYRERLDLNNIMAACTIGCDELFEHGYVYVDENGHVQVGMAAKQHEDLLGFLESDSFVGRKCTAYSSSSQGFFGHHREKIEFRTGAELQA